MAWFAKFLVLFLLVVGVGLSVCTFLISRNISSKFPPTGDYLERNDAKLHYLDSGSPNSGASPVPVVFLHGASSNLNDQRAAFSAHLNAKIRQIYVDRPGHGYSAAFENSNDPVEQARAVADLLSHLEIEKAVISGHSFGSVVAAAFAVLYPKKTRGIVFLAPVSHPWPTGVDWYYDLSNMPFIGWLFTRTIAVPAGYLRYRSALRNVFSPQPVPVGYEEKSATRLVLRPENFHENAKDVAGLIDHVTRFAPRYREIKAPAVIFTGVEDDIVSNQIHADGLSKDIPHIKRIDLPDVGHKPDYAASEMIAEAILKLASDKD